MREFWKNLMTFNKRDCIGLVCWFLVGVLMGLLALPAMVGREICQYEKYHLARFEWEDVVRYSIVILLGSVVNYLIIDWIL